jgi:N-acetylneuraminate lyase
MEKTTGLIAAPHTPMHADGSINPGVVSRYFSFLRDNGIRGIFLNGTTSEGYHLTINERMEMAEAWCDAAKGSDFKIFIFAGHLSGKESEELARHAAGLNPVHGLSVTGPFYQKPATPQLLVDWCASIAAAAPDKPFYYYHIPVLTGITTPMTQFLRLAAEKIPTLAGVKFTHNDLEDFMMARELENGKYDVMAGIDEIAMANRALGAQGYIGSTYNFMAPLFHRLFEAFDSGGLSKALSMQTLAIRIIRIIASYGYISAAKAVMQELGIANGVVRLPNKQISASERSALLQELRTIGFFDYSSK